MTGKEIVPGILSERAVARSDCQDSSGPWWPLDPDHCSMCREFFEHYFPFPWHHHRHHHRRPGITTDHTEIDSPNSVLSCLGLEEFVQAWSILRLGEIWRPSVTVASDRTLHSCIAALVSRVASATAGLTRLQTLVQGASGDQPPAWRPPRDVEEVPPLGRGLGIISVTVSSAPGE